MSIQNPLPPSNIFVTHPYVDGALDIQWDNPAILAKNTAFSIAGVNIYRSFDSELGPYTKINDTPITILQYRDQTTNVLVEKEDVSNSFLSRGDNPLNQWLVQVDNYPIVKENSQAVPANHPNDIKLYIDGQEIPVYKVDGQRGIIELVPYVTFDTATNKNVDPTLPTDTSVVEITYRYNVNLIDTDLQQRIFYKVTTITTDDKETPLINVEPRTYQDLETLDYIWREARRRNRWLLDQAGERVKLFIRKWMGTECECFDHDSNQPKSDCITCYGTGIVGGYEGPFDIKIAPFDTEKGIQLTELGLKLEVTQGTWADSSPRISHRDFIVRGTNERYGIGPVTYEEIRGLNLHQTFTVEILDPYDIRYRVPITGVDAEPYITEKIIVPDEVEIRGRTIVFENINYG